MRSCILTVIKNEHEYLDEWIRYHLGLGIDHIFVFEDIDSASHKEITDKYAGNVTLDGVLALLSDGDREKAIELKQTKTANPQDLYFVAGLLYIQSLNTYDWCFVVDNDEFITLEESNTKLNDVLGLYSDYDAFIMQWKCYGANGLVNKPSYTDKGVVETYTEEVKGHVPGANQTVYTKTCYNLHTYKKEYYWTNHQPKNCNFCKTNFEKSRSVTTYKNIFIRHYITKSWEEYVWKRRTRGYLVGKIRNFDFFFSVNPDMNSKKEELIAKVMEEILVVLPYKQSSSQGNEIKLMLNGWRKFCQFKYHFVVIGEFNPDLKEEFPWVEFIFVPSIPKKEGQYTPHLDIQHKMNIVMTKYDRAYNGFIYATDDEYAIKPFNLEDVTRIFYHAMTFTGCQNDPTWYWSHDKWKTRQLLDSHGLPHINYTTHHPYYLEFKKLDEIWKRFNMLEESYVFDDVYFNYFTHEEPVLDSTIRLGIWNKSIFEKDFQKAVDDPNIKFVCNSVEGWSKELENELWKIVS